MPTHRHLILCVCAVLAVVIGYSASVASAEPQIPDDLHATPLSRVTIKGIPIVINRFGELSAGQSLWLEFVVPERVPAPRSLTTWSECLNDAAVVVESTAKVRANEHATGHWLAQVRMPTRLEKTWVLWILLETWDGSQATRSLPLRQEGHLRQRSYGPGLPPW